MYHNAANGGPSHGHRGSAQKIFVKIGAAIPEICSRTDGHTDRQTDRNTPLPYRGEVTMIDVMMMMMMTTIMVIN